VQFKGDITKAAEVCKHISIIINSMCEAYKDSTFFDSCVGMVISSLLQTSPKFYERGEQFCQNLSLESQANCFENLRYKNLSIENMDSSSNP